MDERLWDLVAVERASLARALEPLDVADWATPSLCAEWTVHEVVAHLVMTPSREPTPASMLAALVGARGRLWTAGRDVAAAYAREHDPQALLASLRDLAGSRAKPVFVQSPNILLDLVVHGQDVAVPLGLHRSVPDETAQVALERVWAMGWPFHARRRLAGVGLRAESSDGTGIVWSAGAGPPVSGSAGDLALLLTSRTTAALPRLRGAGVQVLAHHLDHPGLAP